MKCATKHTKSISHLTYDDIEFTLVRDKVKNINLRIAHDGAVRVSAPYQVDTKTIFDFIKAKKQWILAHKDKLIPKENCFFYLGEEKNVDSIDIPLSQFYSDNAVSIISSRFDMLCKELGISPAPRLVIKAMRGKYGSYTKTTHTVAINAHLIIVPIECIDYVIIHELTHISHFNHGKGFHAALQKYVPNERELKSILSKYILW